SLQRHQKALQQGRSGPPSGGLDDEDRPMSCDPVPKAHAIYSCKMLPWAKNVGCAEQRYASNHGEYRDARQIDTVRVKCVVRHDLASKYGANRGGGIICP